MSTYSSLRATIDANIRANGTQAITGQILNSVLNQMVDSLVAGYLFKGIATTSTSPGTPDQQVFYLAPAGTYANFGNAVIPEGNLGIFWYDSSWHSGSILIAPVLDIVNNLREGGDERLLSAEMGKFLGEYLLGYFDTLTNANTNAGRYLSYTTDGKTRGYVAIPVNRLVGFKGQVSVLSGSPIKYGLSLRPNPTNGNVYTYDSGWLTGGQSVTITGEDDTDDDDKYMVLVATYVSNNTGIPSLQEFLQYAGFKLESYARSGGVAAELQDLNDEVFGEDTEVAITNSNFPDSDYSSYTSAGKTRGVLIYPLSIPFALTISVNVASPIKVGVQGRVLRDSDANSNIKYDSGWITPGQSYSANNADFMNLGIQYIALAFTYVSDNSGIPTLQELRSFISFSYTFGGKTPSLREQMISLQKLRFGIIGHRGMHLNGVPEDSLDAYRYAGVCGFEYAETDFSATSDGYLVLMHDASINRTMRNKADYSNISGTINIASMTLAQLQAGYVLAATDKRYRRTIPLLEDYFKICKQYGMFPLPEIKETGNTQTTIKAAFDMGCEILGEGNFGFCSFSYSFLDYVRSLSKRTPLFYIGSTILNSTNSLTGEKRNSPLDVWYPDYTNATLTEQAVKALHEAGQFVAAWTIPADKYDEIKKMGVDILASDYISPSRMDVGEWVRTDVDFSEFTTGGSVTDNALQLSSGQSASWTGESTWLGGYYLEVIGKGSFTITAPNLSKAISSADIDTFVFAGMCDNKTMQVTITASAASEIQFISFKHWKV